MTDLEPTALALGLLRLVLTGDADVARSMADALTLEERQDVADVIQRSAAAISNTILGEVHDAAGADPVRAAEAVAVLLGVRAWLADIRAQDVERLVVERVDRCICRALGLEA